MIALILAAILGSAVVYFSMQNQQLVSVQLGGYMWQNIPLYLVSLGALLVGLGIAWVVSALGGISSAMALWGKESEVHRLQNVVADLKTRLRNIEIENARLKGDKKGVQSDLAKERVSHTKDRAKSFLDRLRNSLST